MFEIFKIKYLGLQPTAQISDKTLDRIIIREYKDRVNEVNNKLKLIRSDSRKGKSRISVAVLKLSNREFNTIDTYIERCNNDFRDIVTQAEYPRVSKLDFDEIASNKLKNLYLEDWKEYTSWLNKEK